MIETDRARFRVTDRCDRFEPGPLVYSPLARRRLEDISESWSSSTLAELEPCASFT